MTEIIVTVSALIIGWCLREVSQLFRTTKEYKQAIANALSLLLEVRFQILHLENLLHIFKKEGLPEEEVPAVRAQVQEITSWGNDLSEKYDYALETIAKHEPLVAYEYRSKASYPLLIKKLKDLATQQSIPMEIFDKMESQLNFLILPRMNELVTELAKMHSRKNYKEVKRIIEMGFELPDDFYTYMRSTRNLTSNISSTN